MQDQPKEHHHKFIKVGDSGTGGGGDSNIKKLSAEPGVGNKMLEEQHINRDVESEGDALSIGAKEDFFKLQDELNKSIRSKVTQFCMSEKGDCLRLC